MLPKMPSNLETFSELLLIAKGQDFFLIGKKRALIGGGMNSEKVSYRKIMIDGVLLLWFLLTLGSLIFVLWDQFTNTPSMRVMTLAWALVILYTGPLGLFLYFVSCRQPMPNTHDQFIDVHWKQATGSLIHCVAGDATAIILMAAILHFFDVPNGIEVILEYIAAYLFGLFIFQALFMRTMFPAYWLAVKKTIFAETVSMNMVMTGMFPIIVWIKYHYPIASDPFKPYFWGTMSLATIVGFLIAYPINSWMVRKMIKHGMMSKGMTMDHQPPTLPMGQMWAWVIGTYLIFFAVMAFTGLFIPIRFS
ncbi:MAG: hypothetical protein K1000chlam2_00596 [Chlamydiae bacterium]|nr:hypothetical protein [Chlamydiota bacterium]